VVLFCGRVSYQKRPDLLAEAIPGVPKERRDVKFIFAGEGAMLGECERKAMELCVAESCRFLGYVPGAEKEALMNACDLVCIPTAMSPSDWWSWRPGTPASLWLQLKPYLL
jgi:glycosyltransferase involved in cell wall biosynthesis